MDPIKGRFSLPFPSMYTATDLTHILKVSRRTIHRMLASKELPAPVVVGRRARWSQNDIEQFMHAHRAW